MDWDEGVNLGQSDIMNAPQIIWKRWVYGGAEANMKRSSRQKRSYVFRLHAQLHNIFGDQLVQQTCLWTGSTFQQESGRNTVPRGVWWEDDGRAEASFVTRTLLVPQGPYGRLSQRGLTSAHSLTPPLPPLCDRAVLVNESWPEWSRPQLPSSSSDFHLGLCCSSIPSARSFSSGGSMDTVWKPGNRQLPLHYAVADLHPSHLASLQLLLGKDTHCQRPIRGFLRCIFDPMKKWN